MEIRTATAADWPRIIEIYNHAVSDGRCTADIEPLTVEERKDWLEQHTSQRYPIRLAQQGEIVVGWCSISPYRPGRKALAGVGEISYYIAREYRGKGFADRLMNDAIAYAKEQGFAHLLAILLDLNTASLELLKKHGFQQWGALPGIVDFGNLICGQYIFGKKLQPNTRPSPRLTSIL